MPTSAQRRAAGGQTPDHVRVKASDFPPIMLATPMHSWTWGRSATALAELRQHLPPGSVTYGNGAGTSDVAHRRNHIAAEFLRRAPALGLEYCLWIDSDMMPTPSTAVHLLHSAAAVGSDMLSALCFQRIPPFLACVTPVPGSSLSYNGGIQEVAEAGFGCILVHRRVLEALPSPWFKYDQNEPGGGEDIGFCRDARAAGFRIYVDMNLDCGHLAEISVTRDLAIAWQTSEQGRAQLRARRTGR
jgi:hypothetical protein